MRAKEGKDRYRVGETGRRTKSGPVQFVRLKVGCTEAVLVGFPSRDLHFAQVKPVVCCQFNT